MSRRENGVTASKPFKRSTSKSPFYSIELYYGEPGSTGKRPHTTISTNESDYKRAVSARDRIRDNFRRKLYADELSSSEKQPIGECVENYLSRRSNSLASRTEKQYRITLEQFASPKFVHPDTAICNVTRKQLEDFFVSLKGTYRGNKITHNPHTAARVLRAFFNWLIDEGKLTTSPLTRGMVKELRPGKVVQDYFHEELGEFAFFYSQLPNGTYRLRTFKNLFYLAQATGLRLQDICVLRDSDIDSAHGMILLRQHKPGEPVRCILSPQVADAINMQQRNKATHKRNRVRESDWLFPMEYRDFAGQPVTPRMVEAAFLTSRRTIFPDRRGLHFHSLRHTFGQNALNYTGDIIGISVGMGHGSPTVTLSTYATNTRYVKPPQKYATLEEYLGSRQVLSSSASSLQFLTGHLTEKSLTECLSEVESTTSKSVWE